MITLPNHIREVVSVGSKLRIQLGTDLAALIPWEADPDSDIGEVVTVSETGGLTLPDSLQSALGLAVADSLLIWNEGKRIFLEKMVPADHLGLQEPSIHRLPHPADRLEQRRISDRSRYGYAKTKTYDAYLERAPKHEDRPQIGETWVATTQGRRSLSEGKTIPEALDNLRGQLQDDLNDVYSRADMQPVPEIGVRPVYPPDLEQALEQFRERWSAAEAKDRARIAIRPAVLELVDIGLAHEDIAWILELSLELVEEYFVGRAP